MGLYIIRSFDILSLPGTVPFVLFSKEASETPEVADDDDSSSVNPLTLNNCAVFKKDVRHSLSTETSP